MNNYINKKIEEWKKEIGEITENTCPSIDGIIEDIEKYVDEVEYLRKNAYKYESAEDLGKDLPDSGWSGLTSDIDEKLRKDNEKLRELGQFWYEKCQEISLKSREDTLREVWEKIEELKKEINPDGWDDCLSSLTTALLEQIKRI